MHPCGRQQGCMGGRSGTAWNWDVLMPDHIFDCGIRPGCLEKDFPGKECVPIYWRSGFRTDLYGVPPEYRLPLLPARRQDRLHILQIDGFETGKPDLLQMRT